MEEGEEGVLAEDLEGLETNHEVELMAWSN